MPTIDLFSVEFSPKCQRSSYSLDSAVELRLPRMSAIPHQASVPELIAFFKNTDLVSHGAIDVSLQDCPKDDLDQLHKASVGLMARLDTFLQSVMLELEKSLADLKKTEKRINYQTDMLRNDVAAFSSEQSQVLGEISTRVAPALSSEALQKLAQLSLAKTRMEETAKIIKKAQNIDEAQVISELNRLISDHNWAAAENLVKEMEELVVVWNGTNEESARKDFTKSLSNLLLESKPSSASYDEMVTKLKVQKI